MSLKVTNRKTSDLVPYARNARKHSEQQVAQIAASIKEFGFNVPVLIDKDNGIIAGHGRVLAAQKLGMEQVPTIALDHLTENQKKAYILIDNKLALNSEWDEDMLKIELEGLADVDFNMKDLGFSEAELGTFSAEEIGMPELPEGDKQPFQQMTFTLHDEQAASVSEAIAKAKSAGHGSSEVNENSNGNALAFICQSFITGEL